MYEIDLKTKIIFGKNAIEKIPNIVNEIQAKKILILYGGGSIKRNNIFQNITNILDKNNIVWIEFGGIEPNPRHTTIDQAAKLARSEKVDLILAVGGGSTIDASKVIAAMSAHSWNTSWDFVIGKERMENKPVPICSVITLAGTSSENNAGSVVTNEIKKEKYGVLSKAPIYAIEDPSYTFTVNNWQTASGSFDSISHILEQFFGADDFDFSDNMHVALLKTIIKNTYVALKKPNDYKAREALMISCSFGLNSVLKFKVGGDWFVHQFEHALSALWDITHGAGLATISYWYYEWAIQNNDSYKRKAEFLARELFNKKTAEDFIEELRKVINNFALPNKLSKYKEIKHVSQQNISDITDHIKNRGFLNISNNQLVELINEIIH